MTLSWTRSRPCAIAAAALLIGSTVLVGCNSAQSPLNVGVRDVATTLLLGAGGKATVQAPVPPVVVPAKATPKPKPTPTPPPVVLPASTPAPSTTAATSSAPPNPCPGISDLAVPLNPATSTIYSLPKPGSYGEQVTGSVTKGSATVDLPSHGTWTVGAISPDWTGSYTFAQAVTSGDTTTTTTYRVVPAQNAAPNQVDGTSVDPGIYISSVATTSLPTFALPDPGMELARFPLLQNGTVHVSVVSGTTTMTYTATVKGMQTINACGTALSAFEIDLVGTIVDSTISGPDGTQKFTTSYFVGTQYGGLLLASTSHVTGTDDGVPVTRDVSTLPTSEPALAETELPAPCTLPDPSAPVLAAAPDVPTGTVPLATFAYRNDDLIGVDSLAPTRQPWAVSATVTVPAGQPGQEQFYTVVTADETGKKGTTTIGIVRPDSTGPLKPGLYLVRNTGPAGDTQTYSGPGMMLAALPLVPGAAVTSSDAGVWGTESFTATVAGHATVATCDGVNLDSWEIDLGAGQVTSTADQASGTFTATYFVGTQYGGLLLGDQVRSTTSLVLPGTGLPTVPDPGTDPTATGSASAPVSAAASSSVPATATATATASTSTSAPEPVPVTLRERATMTINGVPKDATSGAGAKSGTASP